jgi:hypothetical protein
MEPPFWIWKYSPIFVKILPQIGLHFVHMMMRYAIIPLFPAGHMLGI